MTLAGWVLMTTSLGLVLTLTVYCFWRVLTLPRTKHHLHAPLDIETHGPGN